MTTIDPNDDWQSGLLRDEQGQLLCWESNAYLILTNDPAIKDQLLRLYNSQDIARATYEIMLFLQANYRLKLSYQMLTYMVRHISEAHNKATGRVQIDPSYFSRR